MTLDGSPYSKMTNDNGTDLQQHATDLDISKAKDHFAWNQIFIRWFEDYQLPNMVILYFEFFFPKFLMQGSNKLFK